MRTFLSRLHFFLYRTPNLMIKAPSPLFLCGYLVRVSEASPRQRTCVPAQHAVTQRLQVTASRRSWSQNTHAHRHTHLFFRLILIHQHYKAFFRCAFHLVFFHSQVKEPFTLKDITISSTRKKNLIRLHVKLVCVCADRWTVGGVQVSLMDSGRVLFKVACGVKWFTWTRNQWTREVTHLLPYVCPGW